MIKYERDLDLDSFNNNRKSLLLVLFNNAEEFSQQCYSEYSYSLHSYSRRHRNELNGSRPRLGKERRST